jgi:hypothetical protein
VVCVPKERRWCACSAIRQKIRIGEKKESIVYMCASDTMCAFCSFFFDLKVESFFGPRLGPQSFILFVCLCIQTTPGLITPSLHAPLHLPAAAARAATLAAEAARY